MRDCLYRRLWTCLVSAAARSRPQMQLSCYNTTGLCMLLFSMCRSVGNRCWQALFTGTTDVIRRSGNTMKESRAFMSWATALTLADQARQMATH